MFQIKITGKKLPADGAVFDIRSSTLSLMSHKWRHLACYWERERTLFIATR